MQFIGQGQLVRSHDNSADMAPFGREHSYALSVRAAQAPSTATAIVWSRQQPDCPLFG
jgi:hypothetical protein